MDSSINFKRKLQIRTADIALNHDMNIDYDEVDHQSLTFEHTRRPLLVLLGMCGIAVVVFIGEILYFKWRDRSSS